MAAWMALQVLRQIGLRSEMDHVTFLACARELESWGLAMAGTDEAQAAESIVVARELVQELRSNTALLTNELFRALRDVAFVPATKVRFKHVLHIGVRPCGLGWKSERCQNAQVTYGEVYVVSKDDRTEYSEQCHRDLIAQTQ